MEHALYTCNFILSCSDHTGHVLRWERVDVILEDGDISRTAERTAQMSTCNSVGELWFLRFVPSLGRGSDCRVHARVVAW